MVRIRTIYAAAFRWARYGGSFFAAIPLTE